MSANETFVKLKYQIITREWDTWVLCKTYPHIVRSRWAQRCAENVEHLIIGDTAKEDCVKKLKTYKVNAISPREFFDCYSDSTSDVIHSIGNSISTYIHPSDFRSAAKAAMHAAYAYSRAYAANNGRAYTDMWVKQWDLYTIWLIEELANH